jgi:polyhydroxyalkanoate synthase subunit PhaC
VPDFVSELDPWIKVILSWVAVLSVAFYFLLMNWVFASRKVDARFIEAGPLRRLWRWYRSLWLRSASAVAGWPHIVNRALGTPKTAVAPTPASIVWEQLPVRLYRYSGATRHKEPILLVHAVISRPWILDLAPERSFVEFLKDRGFDVFLLDWGDPGPEESRKGLSAYTDALMRAEHEVLSKSGASRVHLVGYCLGGTLSLARAAARDHGHIGSLTLLATPVDFTVPSGLQPFISHRLFKPVYFLDGSSCVPASAIRESMHVLRPQALKTVIGAWRRRKDQAFRRVYDPLARWVWEQRRLPGQLYFDLVDLFRTNSLLEGRLVVSGEMTRLESIEAPILALIAERDHIIPSGSAHILSTIDNLDLTVVNAASGHVSMVSGATARETTWPQIERWLDQHQSRR